MYNVKNGIGGMKMITAIFYGSIFLSLFFFALALIRNSWVFILLSVILALPYSLYFSFVPMFRWMLLIPVSYMLVFYYYHKKIQAKAENR